MSIHAFKAKSWTSRVLVKGDSIGCLEVLEELNRLTAAHMAGQFLAPNFAMYDPVATHAEITELLSHNELTQQESNRLTHLLAVQNNITGQETAIRLACAPRKTFIDSHIDAGLESLIRHIASRTDIPVYRQVRECRDLIAQACLGTPTDVRARLIKRFKMGKARSAAEVIVALDNFDVVIKQINTHYETVLNTVDEARTNAARRVDPNAPPYYEAVCRAAYGHGYSELLR